MTTPHVDLIKQFGMTNQLIEHDLDRVEREYGIDLHRGHRRSIEADEDYYPQIERVHRAEAARMAPQYEVFYSLEKTIRAFVSDAIATEENTEDWWNGSRVPPTIKTDAEKRHQREIDQGTTPRSDDMLDFTNFGELSEIIKTNWDIFGGMLSSKKAVENVMARLNSLRGPIAHCSPLADDEIPRLTLSVRDWFRLMD